MIIFKTFFKEINIDYKAGLIKLPVKFIKNTSENFARYSKNFFFNIRFFIYNFKNCSLLDACYELISKWRGVAQLGSAGALGALGRRFESCRPDS